MLAQALRINVADQSAPNRLFALCDLPLLLANPLLQSTALLLDHGDGALMLLLDRQSGFEQWIKSEGELGHAFSQSSASCASPGTGRRH
jgi:hypothetical protein